MALWVLHLREIRMKTTEKKKKGTQELGLGKGMAKLKQILLQQLELEEWQPLDMGLPQLANVLSRQTLAETNQNPLDPGGEPSYHTYFYKWPSQMTNWFAGNFLQHLVAEFKSIVDSNEVARLPKIAKVINQPSERLFLLFCNNCAVACNNSLCSQGAPFWCVQIDISKMLNFQMLILP
jgi:hypothetical protein